MLSLFKIWGAAYKFRLLLFFRKNALRKYLNSLRILSSEESISKIMSEKLSVCRYGDGEFYVMGNGGNYFQEPNEKLAGRLRDILKHPLDNLLICLPHTLNDYSNLRAESYNFAAAFAYFYAETCVRPFVKTNLTYGDNLMTRFYMHKRNKNGCQAYFQKLRNLWVKRNLLIVEGNQTRLGIGNDSLSNASSIRRILCPNENAFDLYDKILDTVLQNVLPGELIVLSLGMTATVLAYDLCKAGHQALDLGHFDVEYEWMRMNAKSKCAVPGKRVAEVTDGRELSGCNDSVYESQIIARI